MATQSRIASLTASFRVRLPVSAGRTSAPEQAHAEDVERLARHVDLAHVDDALHAEEGGGGGGGDAVLAGAGLGHEPGLAHALGEQGLAEDVVDLVAAGVVEVLPLEEDPAPELGTEPLALGEDRRPAGVVAEQVVELAAERRVGPRLAEGDLELLARGHQRLGDVAAAEPAEATVGAGSPMKAARSSVRAIAEGSRRLVGRAEPVAGRYRDRRRSGSSSSRTGRPRDRPRRARRRRPGVADEVADLDGILVAGRALDAGGHVDAPRLHPLDGLADVVGREASGEDEPAPERRALGQRPVEDLARARRVRVDHDGVGGVVADASRGRRRRRGRP